MVDITTPTVGQDQDAWGPILNTALETLEAALTTAEATIVTLDASKVAKAGDSLTGALNTTSVINVTAAATTTDSLTVQVSGDTNPRLIVNGDGRLDYGPGNAGADTSLQRASTAQLRITPTANSSASTSVGGALNITNTANTGAGAVIYSDQAAPAGHLLVVRADNAAFNQSGIFAQYDGTGHNVNISHAGTGTNSSALNIGSTNADHSAVGIGGVETAKGTVKITHTGTGADASASAISIDLAGTGTASQGIFITGTGGGTTGNLIEARNGGTGPVFRITSAGQIHLGSGTGSPDVVLRRSAANELTVDDYTVLAASGQSNGTFSVFSAASNALRAGSAGGGLSIAEGANARMGTATLVAGAVTVANTSVTATTRIFLTSQADGGTPGFLRVSARTAATSFTITSSSGTDTSTIAWLLVEP